MEHEADTFIAFGAAQDSTTTGRHANAAYGSYGNSRIAKRTHEGVRRRAAAAAGDAGLKTHVSCRQQSHPGSRVTTDSTSADLGDLHRAVEPTRRSVFLDFGSGS